MDACPKCGAIDWEPYDPPIWRTGIDFLAYLWNLVLPPWEVGQTAVPYFRCCQCRRIEKDRDEP